jgi:Fur family ferric uptake transcriptional regulator
MKLTKQRAAIADVFFSGERHLSLTDILELARARHRGIGYATVYRTMRLMCAAGLADEHRFGEGETQYEACREGEHHDHIICVSCGSIVEFESPEIERLQDAVAKAHRFQVTSHRHEIYGVCASCTEAQAAGEVAVDR